MNRLPAKFYRVKVLNGEKLGYRDVGSKTYADIKHAQNHMDRLESQGVASELWETLTDWRLVPAPETQVDGQQPLWSSTLTVTESDDDE